MASAAAACGAHGAARRSRDAAEADTYALRIELTQPELVVSPAGAPPQVRGCVVITRPRPRPGARGAGDLLLPPQRLVLRLIGGVVAHHTVDSEVFRGAQRVVDVAKQLWPRRLSPTSDAWEGPLWSDADDAAAAAAADRAAFDGSHDDDGDPDDGDADTDVRRRLFTLTLPPSAPPTNISIARGIQTQYLLTATLELPRRGATSRWPPIATLASLATRFAGPACVVAKRDIVVRVAPAPLRALWAAAAQVPAGPADRCSERASEPSTERASESASDSDGLTRVRRHPAATGDATNGDTASSDQTNHGEAMDLTDDGAVPLDTETPATATATHALQHGTVTVPLAHVLGAGPEETVAVTIASAPAPAAPYRVDRVYWQVVQQLRCTYTFTHAVARAPVDHAQNAIQPRTERWTEDLKSRGVWYPPPPSHANPPAPAPWTVALPVADPAWIVTGLHVSPDAVLARRQPEPGPVAASGPLPTEDPYRELLVDMASEVVDVAHTATLEVVWVNASPSLTAAQRRASEVRETLALPLVLAVAPPALRH
ncbi:hypothetical protein CXG81DRAFT_27316 [Caulochytrium protostelioides]|uniref:Uncharacterized protein n=1 Tax=Caulochytrium protostelioides TaxID=1555241 RepID=A0A4P9X4I4_9FUNG|nr:hypothetical protein CXG81DRAFT_27316 [Caulochytrium protostelioides]|eukprot:RKO99964.1 hypothetical protein CXG81DRAFT_27316 [Caulochytrium protostelioides]